MKRAVKKAVAAMGLVLVGVLFAQQAASNVVTNVPLAGGASAKIDWTQGLLIAEGMGTAPKGLTQAQAEVRALAAARADAQRVLLSAIQGVQVTSETTVKNFELQDDEIKVKVQGLLQGAIPVLKSEKIEKKNDGSFVAKISYSIPMYGGEGVASVIFPVINAQNEAKPAPQAQPTKPASPAPKPGTTAPANTGSDQLPTYSGLIVDARGKGYLPCMSPKIKMIGGKEVWGTAYVTTEFADTVGIASFVKRTEDALRLRDRGAPNQLILKATKALGKAKCDAEISENDAALLIEANSKYGFLQEFKVTFVF